MMPEIPITATAPYPVAAVITALAKKPNISSTTVAPVRPTTPVPNAASAFFNTF